MTISPIFVVLLIITRVVTRGFDLVTTTPNLRSASKTTEDSSLQPIAAGIVEGAALPTPPYSATHALIHDKINSASSSTASFHELKVSHISAFPANPSAVKEAVLEITTQACSSANVVSRSTK